MNALSYVIYAVVAVAFFAILYSMAKTRGRNPVLWGIFGALTNLIALIVLPIAGKSDDLEAQSR